MFENVKIKIANRIKEGELEKKLKSNLENKYVDGEQWFKKPELWYELTAFSNPYITVYSELVLLIKNSEIISNLLSDHTLVFYGLGTGDTEIILVRPLLDVDKNLDIVGIEVQSRFIDGFVQSLENVSLEDDKYKINFLGINGLFQDVEKKDLEMNDKKQAHIILGNTVGNFREKEIFGIFNKLMNKDDILLVGFQTDKNIEKIFKQYADNKMFNNFIRKTVPNCKKLEWVFNKGEEQIEAWSDDILVFHSKKKSEESMRKTTGDFGFENLYEVSDNNSCIQISKKI